MPDVSARLTRCLLCGSLLFALNFVLVVGTIAQIGKPHFWSGLAATLALAAVLAWAHWRWCPDRAWLRAERLIRLADATLYVKLPADGNRLSDWLCGDAWLHGKAIPVQDIQALRLTPGYLAIYLKPQLMAVDVFFDAGATETVRRILAPLAHLFVEEVPRLVESIQTRAEGRVGP